MKEKRMGSAEEERKGRSNIPWGWVYHALFCAVLHCITSIFAPWELEEAVAKKRYHASEWCSMHEEDMRQKIIYPRLFSLYDKSHISITPFYLSWYSSLHRTHNYFSPLNTLLLRLVHTCSAQYGPKSNSWSTLSQHWGSQKTLQWLNSPPRRCVEEIRTRGCDALCMPVDGFALTLCFVIVRIACVKRKR